VSIPKGNTQRFRITTGLSASYAEQGQAVGYDLYFSAIQNNIL
jgi:hypothetical protein